MDLSRLNALKQEIANTKKKMLTEGKALLEDATKQLFEKHTSLESFSWTQYTPFFNDGEPCTFSCHADYPSLTYAGQEVEEVWLRDGSVSWYGDDPKPEGLDEAAADLVEVLSIFKNNEELAQDAYGDHCKVIVKRAGATIEDYHHD